MRVYFDVCCLGRVFEESDQQRIKNERLAMESIIQQDFEFVSSDVVSYEIARDPDEERRDAKLILDEELRCQVVQLTESIASRARELSTMGFGSVDALQLASAEAANCIWFFTTDDRLLNRAVRLRASLKVAVDNPASWVLRYPKR